MIGNLTEGSFQIANSIFSKNSDGIFLAFNNSFTIIIINCTIIDTTRANWTLKLLQSVLYITGNTTFVNNTGGSYAVASNVTFSGYTRFENCGTISSSGGVISSHRSNIHFSGETHMISNQGDIGGAIVSTGSVVSISGNAVQQLSITRQIVEVAFISKIVFLRLKECIVSVSSSTTPHYCRVEEPIPLVQPSLCISGVLLTSLTIVQKTEVGFTLK